MSTAGRLRSFAQAVRHAPGAERLDPLWALLRKPYRWLLGQMAHDGVEVRVGGHAMRLHPSFASIGWEAVERETYGEFVAQVASGDVVIDVGAHAGTYTILASRAVGPSGCVVAFEPDDQARSYLRQHLAWNACVHNVIVRDRCLAATVGESDFYYLPNDASGRSGLVGVAGHAKRTLRTTTLDAELQELQISPNIIKIDIEGAELEALRGMAQTLSVARPRLFVSIHPTALAQLGNSTQQVLSWIEAQGYTTRRLAYDYELHVYAYPRQP